MPTGTLIALISDFIVKTFNTVNHVLPSIYSAKIKEIHDNYNISKLCKDVT